MKNIKLLTICGVVLGAANAFAATNIDIKGSNNSTAPLTLSSQLPATYTAADSLLWKGNGSNQRNDAYLAIDGKYEFVQFFISGGGGAYADAYINVDANSSLTLTTSTGFGFNGGEYAIDMNFTGSGNNSNIVFKAGYDVSLLVKVLSEKNQNGEIKRNISFGTGLTVTNNQSLKVTGAEGSAFTINSTWNNAGQSNFINGTVNIGGNYTSAGTTSLDNVTLNIDKDATYKTGGNLTFKAGTTANISGTLEVAGNLLFDKEGENPVVNIADGATIKAQTFRTRNLPLVIGNGTQVILKHTTDGTGSTFINAGASEIKAGGSLSITVEKENVADAITNHNTLIVNGTLSVTGADIATARNGITFNTSNVTLTDANIKLGNESDLGDGKITVNADNNFANSVLCLGKYTSTSNTHKLVLGKDADLIMKGFSFSNNDTEKFADYAITLEITLGENATLALTDFITEIENYGGTMNNDDKIVIKGFRENAISIKNHTEVDDSLLSKITASGVTDPLRWAYDNANNVYWLSAIAIPEPAEWAAIFGALALGLAMYRKRK